MEPVDQPPASKPRHAGRKAKRRRDILAAARAVFSEQGFAAARLDDVAARAGVAKGTLYLYFSSKDAMFEELLREAVKPIQGRLARILADPRISTRDALTRLMATFRRDVLETDARLVLRLMIAEGPRFPKLTAFYHREVLSKALPMVRAILARGHERGEIASATLAETPQLVVAPAILAVIWNEICGQYEPLDLDRMFETHIDLLLGAVKP